MNPKNSKTAAKKFSLRERGGERVTVRNQWWARRQRAQTLPDSVLLDIGVPRGGGGVCTCASLTPHMARRIAAALLKAADEAEAKGRR